MKPMIYLLLAAATVIPDAWAATTKSSPAVELVQKTAEAQIKNIVEPVFRKYCQDECKLLGIDVSVDVAYVEDAAPGFEEIDPSSQSDLAPAKAEIKLLLDEKLGPKSRGRVLDLVNQYLESLDYPVTINSKSVKFPSPAEAASRVSEMRERLTTEFQSTVQKLVQEYCPKDCLFSEFGLDTELVNVEEAQFGGAGEFLESGGFALRIRGINGTLLMDESISEADRTTFTELVRFKTSQWKNVNIDSRPIRFPRIAGMSNAYGAEGRGRLFEGRENNSETNRKENSLTENRSTQNSQENRSLSSTQQNTENRVSQENRENNVKESFQRFEKIERVENGDALATEFAEMKRYGLILAALVLALLVFNAVASLRSKIQIQSDGKSASLPLTGAPFIGGTGTSSGEHPTGEGTQTSLSSISGERLAKRFESERLKDELLKTFVENPRVAKYVFTKILTEEGIETVSAYINIFGESVVLDMLRDPSLQSDLNELMDYYARASIELTEDQEHQLLKRLHHRTVSGKLAVTAARTTYQFEFLAEMDGMQILELIRNESLTVKSIVLTQVDNQKRTAIFNQMEESTRMKIMNELSRIDYLPREYITNVASALKRKRQENPRLNTEALPGSEVLVHLLERAEGGTQQTVLRNLEMNNPDSARVVKHKLVSLDTLAHLPDGQLLEVILSLKHEELIQFLKGVRADIREIIYSKSPRDLVGDLEEELASAATPSRDNYSSIERKVLNRVKIMAQDNLINLSDVNDRMLARDASGRRSAA